MSKLSEAAIASQLAEHEKWKGAGGEFGLSADWRQALLRDDGSGGQSLRGEACLTDEKQAQVRDILQKRASTTKKVFFNEPLAELGASSAPQLASEARCAVLRVCSGARSDKLTSRTAPDFKIAIA